MVPGSAEFQSQSSAYGSSVGRDTGNAPIPGLHLGDPTLDPLDRPTRHRLAELRPYGFASGRQGVSLPDMDLSDEHWRDHIMTNGPVGAWCALPGSHTQLFDEAIDFGVEGRGELRTHSPMRGAESLAFIWRVGGYGVVECQPVYASPEIGDDGQANAADWFRLPFVIELQRTDAGTFWALRERGAQASGNSPRRWCRSGSVCLSGASTACSRRRRWPAGPPCPAGSRKAAVRAARRQRSG